jgi:bacterioferritin
MAILKNEANQKKIVDLLTKAYWMEIETVMSYIANSINPDGIRALEVRESLAEDIPEELGHARKFAERIKVLYGKVPGSGEFKSEQTYLQPPLDNTDVVHVIKGVIAAEQGAINYYRDLIEKAEELGDPVTADMVTEILGDEEHHLREFEGFLKEYERK